MPNSWSHKTFGEFIAIKRGYDLTHDERIEGNVPVYGAAGKNGFHNRFKALAPGIVMGRSGGSFGKVHFVNEDFWPHNTAMYVTDFRGNDPYFTYYYLSNLDFSSFNSGSAQPSLNRNYLYPIRIKVPEKETQKSIGGFLKSLDSKISLNNRINAELEAMAKLIYDYWFVQFDFPISREQAAAMGKPELEGKPYKASGGKMVWNEELKREIPEGWEVKELGKLLDCNYRNLKKEDGLEFINYLDTSNLTGNEVKELQYLSRNHKWPSRAQRLISAGDILYSTVRPNQNHHGIIKSVQMNMIGSTGFAQLRSKFKELKPDLIYTFLKSDWVTMRLHQIAELSVTSYPSISPDDILFLKTPLPKLDEPLIQKAGDILDSFYSKINSNQLENQKLAELRDWLLPMLMNGQVRVSSAKATKAKVGEVKEYVQKDEIRIAAEPEPRKLSNGDKTVLAGKIIQMTNSNDFGRVKLQKLLHLCEYHCQLNLQSSYVKKAAGPHDPKLIRQIEADLKRFRFFEIQQSRVGKHRVTYKALGAAAEIEGFFHRDFAKEAIRIEAFLAKFSNKSWEECEIVSTLYAVWNNRIIKGQRVTDELLKQDFFEWDEQKIKYKDRLDGALEWMRKKDVVPVGFGKYIESKKSA